MLLPVRDQYASLIDSCKTEHSRFNKTLDYFEETLKLLSLTLISLYRDAGFPDIKINDLLQKLSIPSLGDWNGFMTAILKWARNSGNKQNTILLDIDRAVNDKIDDPKFIDCFRAFSLEVDGKESGARAVPYRSIIDYVIRIRNKIAHGGKPSEEFYDKISSLTKESIDIWIDIAKPFDGYELTAKDAKSEKEDDFRQDCSLRELYTGNMVLSYYPFIVYNTDGERYYINGNNRLKRAEYINHTKGLSFSDEDILLKEQIAFFGTLKGLDIKASDLGSKVATSLAELNNILARYEYDPDKKVVGNDFQIIEEIGRGGMGIVFKALQISTNRVVALKVLPKSIVSDETIFYRFKREAKTLEEFDHPHIVEFIEFGETDDDVYLAMEFIDGVGLDKIYSELRQIESGKRPVEDDIANILTKSGTYIPGFTDENDKRPYYYKITEWIGETASALSYIHGKNILHRDIKPGNIMIDRHTGRAVLLDFGLAKTQDVSVTMQGQFVGTMRYASPEQIAAAKHIVDEKSDQYSLGATLYELLTLRPIFVGDTLEKMSSIITTIDPPKVKLLSSDIPSDLEVITMKTLEKDSKRRYGTIKEFEDDIESFLSHKPIKAKPPTTFQRLGKWMKRNPAKTSGIGVALAAVTILAVIVITATWQITIKNNTLLANQTKKRSETVFNNLIMQIEEIYTFNKSFFEVIDLLNLFSANEDIGFVAFFPYDKDITDYVIKYSTVSDNIFPFLPKELAIQNTFSENRFKIECDNFIKNQIYSNDTKEKLKKININNIKDNYIIFIPDYDYKNISKGYILLSPIIIHDMYQNSNVNIGEIATGISFNKILESREKSNTMFVIVTIISIFVIITVFLGIMLIVLRREIVNKDRI